jgi:hypothetical protein
MRNGLGGEAAVSAGPTSPIATSEARAKCEQQQQEEEVGKGSAMDGSLNGADDGGGGGGGGAVGSNASSVAATKRQRNFASDTIFFFLWKGPPLQREGSWKAARKVSKLSVLLNICMISAYTRLMSCYTHFIPAWRILDALLCPLDTLFMLAWYPLVHHGIVSLKKLLDFWDQQHNIGQTVHCKYYVPLDIRSSVLAGTCSPTEYWRLPDLSTVVLAGTRSPTEYWQVPASLPFHWLVHCFFFG